MSWDYVEDGANTASFSRRTSEKQKKKWDDIKQSTKKIAFESKEGKIKTGGGKKVV